MIAVIIITSLCFVSVFISYIAFRKGFTKSADDYLSPVPAWGILY